MSSEPPHPDISHDRRFRHLQHLLELAHDIVDRTQMAIRELEKASLEERDTRRPPAIPLEDCSQQNLGDLTTHVRIGELLRLAIRQNLPRAGNPGAHILLQLLESPGVFIDQQELLALSRISSPGDKAVKVYIFGV